MRIIGINGLKGSGKSTFANYLEEELRDNHQRRIGRIAFATPMKAALMDLFGGAPKDWYGTDADKLKEMPYWAKLLGEKYSSPRRIMQTFGTDIFRNTVNENFWLFVFNKQLQDSQLGKSPDIVITDDVRFNNEAEYIRNVGGQVIVVRRMGVTQTTDPHASEAGIVISDKDLTFDFNSLDEMKKCARTIAPKLIKETKEVDLCSWLKSLRLPSSSASPKN